MKQIYHILHQKTQIQFRAGKPHWEKGSERCALSELRKHPMMAYHSMKWTNWWSVPKCGKSLTTFVVSVEGGGDGISDYELHLCSIVVATIILYISWQRPGAICNATLDKLKAAKVVVKDGKTVIIISIAVSAVLALPHTWVLHHLWVKW